MRALALFTLCSLSACSSGDGAQPPKPKNLLLITVDTTRADHLGCYGNESAHTPVLDSLAKGGVLFENCFAPTPITLPSHASLLTGLRPPRHGARNNATHPLPIDIPTLAERFKTEGFQTGAVVSALVLDSRYGLARGFDVYDDNLSSADSVADFMIRETTADDTTRRALNALQSLGDGPWFLWVHYFDPHADYNPPSEYLELCPDRPYDAEIAFVDAQLGILFDALGAAGQFNQTLVAVTSDHGESLGEHGERTHGFFLYDATTHVPLILSSPFLNPARNEALSGTIDLAPTLCTLMDIPFHSGEFDGVDLFAENQSRSPVYQESMVPFLNHGWSDLRAMRSKEARFIRAPRNEFQDFGNSQWTAESLEQALNEILKERDRGFSDNQSPPTNPDERKAMEALGYVWEEVSLTQGVDLADPKDCVEEWERNQEIYELVRKKKYEKAEAILRKMIQEAPGALDPRKTLARVLSETNRSSQAFEELKQASTLPGADSELFVRLAELSHKLHLEWRNYLGLAKKKNPSDPIPWVMEGNFLLKEKNSPGAQVAYDRALSLDSTCPPAWLGLGKLHHRRGELPEAAESLEKALESDSFLPEAWFARGVIAMASKEAQKAEECFRMAIQLKPDHANAFVNLGNLLFRQDKLKEARSCYESALELRPNHTQARFNYAALLEEVGDYQALESLKRTDNQ